MTGDEPQFDPSVDHAARGRGDLGFGGPARRTRDDRGVWRGRLADHDHELHAPATEAVDLADAGVGGLLGSVTVTGSDGAEMRSPALATAVTEYDAPPLRPTIWQVPVLDTMEATQVPSTTDVATSVALTVTVSSRLLLPGVTITVIAPGSGTADVMIGGARAESLMSTPIAASQLKAADVLA